MERPGRIKPISRIQRHKKFVKLKQLGCFATVDEMIRGGHTARAVALFIQKDCGEYTDITKESLETLLLEYRKSIPPAQIAERVPLAMERAVEKLRDGINVLDELAEMIRLQKTRIAMDHKHEQTIQKALPSLGAEIKNFKDLVVAYAEVEQSLGLAPKNLGSVEVTVNADVTQTSYEAPVQAVLQDPTKRRRLMGIVDQIRTMAGAGVSAAALQGKSRVVEAETAEGDGEIDPSLLSDDLPDAVD